MPDTTPSTVTAEPRRISIRLPPWGWCLLSTVVLVLGYGGLSVWLPYHREQPIIEALEGRGESASIKTETVGPGWLRSLVGEDRMKKFRVFERVSTVELIGEDITDAEVDHLTGLRNIRKLWLYKTAVTDAGLARLRAFGKLEYLSLRGTKVTDAALADLSVLPSLRKLHLAETAVTDASLPHLSSMRNLEYLGLDHTAITDKGIEELKTASPHCEIIH
jgi:hypothetical protein